MKFNNIKTNVAFIKILCDFHLISIFFLLVISSFRGSTLKAQPAPINTPCYSIEEGGSQPNTLFELINNNWVKKGYITSVDGNINGKIEAMAAKPNSDTLYVVDKNIFGTINVNTLKFKFKSYVMGEAGAQIPASGEYGNQLFDDIDGMAYDPYLHEIWAINRNAGNGSGTEDFLIKIDPDSGRYIKGAFEGGHDYAVIPSVYDGTLGGDVYDVDGIAFNPYTGALYLVQNQEGPGVISEINKTDGSVEDVIYDMGEDDIEGLGMSTYGQLFGTSGDNGFAESSFIFIDLLNVSTQNLTTIDPTGQFTDFESFDCAIGLFDLAMKVELATNPINVTANSNVSFNITIKNQGDVEVDGYTLSAYLPAGLSLTNTNWTTVAGNNNKIRKQVDIKLSAGQTKLITLGLKVAANPPTNLRLACEISEMYNTIIDDVHNFRVALPDIDSMPDYNDNETNIVDNAMSQGGPKTTEDEDDHDIVNVNVKGLSCQNNLNITGSILDGSYLAELTILSNGTIASANAVQFTAGSAITLNNGFTANANTNLEIMINSCP